MQAYDRLRQLADDWHRLRPNHEIAPAQREELAQRTAECLAYLVGAQAASDPVVIDLSLARAIRLCERLAKAIQAGEPVPQPIEASPTVERAQDTAITVTLGVGTGAVVEIRGRVERRDLVRALKQLDQTLGATDGALLIDAQGIDGYAPECARVLATWVASRAGMRLRRVAVVVAQRAQFVRASRALATATGIGWLIAHDRASAEAWMGAGGPHPMCGASGAAHGPPPIRGRAG